MSDQLIPVDESRTSGELVESLKKTSEFLPQVRVYGSSNDIVKEGLFPMGHFGLYFNKDQIVDLEDAFDCLVIDWRPRASIVVGDQPVSYYGRYNEETKQWDVAKEFTDIKDKAMDKQAGYLAGLEYLLWIPGVGKYALFFMGNTTLRRESANLQSMVGKAATLKIKLIKTSSYTWHGARILACETPFNLPSEDSLKQQMENFRDPKDAQVEMVDEEEQQRAR